ncbi:DUF5682 family protein [Sinosporangium siamense]|uniref:Uncharacterized protein n=1 Tax=Sinosporangium siamense TaxID=1367973 RepID=A0A919REK2_9ACTN|nr:DUF5682 family protein [Sinosporangium siamense]GII92257.1 hypothetical protein Ssi02_24880 [Sinosporangium siamense]
MTSTDLLGVRHHGPGSARAVRDELARLRPDIVLIEGPPEADALVALAADPDLRPPVALLAHVPGEPGRAAYWPFAEFSPEWQAIRYAAEAGVPARFCDLPAAHGLAAPREDEPGDEEDLDRDPLGELAYAAGYDDPERWWEDVVEHRGDTPFRVIAEAMAAVRDGHVPSEREARREAHMRRTVRRAAKEGFGRIAVVCGAWHVPALALPVPARADDALLRGLPKVKVEVTWVPWTYGRLGSWSGYGAGVASPGWYDHLFTSPDRPVERWLTAAAGVLREEGLPVSSAHVIEAVRLAQSLAALRGRPLAGLGEVTEAARAVLCEGDDLPVELIQRRMVVGERLGRVPDSTPMVPLQRDLRDQQRRLRLKPTALERELDLDLRKPLDLERSKLLHRLILLGVGWGTPRDSRGKGTFRESWTLIWGPENDLLLIEAGVYGTTVEAAASARVREHAGDAPSAGTPANGEAAPLDVLTTLVEKCLLADLPDALPHVLSVLSARAALDTDVTRLMAALPAVARAQRYGDVRGTSTAGLASIAEAMLTRVCVGLPATISGIGDEAAAGLLTHIDGVNSAVVLLGDANAAAAGGGSPAPRDRWLAALRLIADRSDLHGLIDGRLTRILFDAGTVDADQVAVRLSRAMSPGNPPARTASWVEGFLPGDGLLLVHDARLLALVDDWLTALTLDQFTGVLPLLRRTFGAFAPPERRSIGERVRARGGDAAAAPTAEVDGGRAAAAVQTVRRILQAAAAAQTAGAREGTSGGR